MSLEHEGNQEGISKDDFLDNLISEIDGLLEQNGGLKNFRRQFDNFCLMVESYCTELDQYRQLANNRFKDFAEKNMEPKESSKDIVKLPLQELIKLSGEQLKILNKVKKLYIGQCSTPPSNNPTWVLHVLMSDYVVEDDWITRAPLVYRPSLLELPTNPVFWFFREMDKYLSDSDPIKQPNEKELLMCDFVRLAVIHDESCDYNKSIMIYKNKKYTGNFTRADFSKDLWEAYKNPKKDNFIRTHKRILQQALNHVKSNLVQPQTNIYFKNNFIKATIKHLPYFGPYLFDLIYGVDSVKPQKKENESNAISEKQIAGPKNKGDLAETEQRARDSGDTYNIIGSHVSLGDKAQHAGRDITTQEQDKEKGGWGLIKKISLILGIIASLIAILGVYNKYIRKDKPAIERIKTQNLSGNSVDVNNVVFDTRPTADAIIEEIERLPVFEQKVAAENYIGRTFKWRLRFEVLVHEEGGMVYVACKASSMRGKVSFNINANAKENLKIKKIKKGKFLDVSGEIMGISLAREREPRISLKDVRLEFVD